MRRRSTLAAAAACILALAGMPAAADAAPTDDLRPAGRATGALLTTKEAGCTEITYPRGGLASAVRPLVPVRFELVPFPAPDGVPARVTLFITEVTCRTVTTATAQRRDKQRDVAFIIVSADTATIDGQPSDGVYVLFYATENRTLHRAFNDLGWPTDLLHRRSGVNVTTTPGGLTQATGTFVGSGWNHIITFASVLPFGQPDTGLGIYYRDTGTRQLKQCFDSTIRSVFGMVTGDLTTTPLATVTAVPPVFAGFSGTPSNGTFLYTGSWQSTLTDQNCPTSAGHSYSSTAQTK